MVAVRRRTSRRRSTTPPVKQKVLAVLIGAFFFLLTLIAIPGARLAARRALGKVSFLAHIPPEVFALLMAGVALLLLLPGVEDKVLTVLGLRKKHRSRNSHR